MPELPPDHPYAGGRTCKDCEEFKPASAFQIDRDVRYKHGVSMRPRCKPCRRTKTRGYDLKRHYGITSEEYDEMLAAQNGCCAICDSSSANNSRADENLFVDHDHETGEVRGLLCSKCNHAIGLLNDDPELLMSARAYLTRGS